MPRKSRPFREKKAKAAGITASFSDAELGESTRSKHAAKKSAHLAKLDVPEGRKVFPKSPPGEGRKTIPARAAAAASAFKRSEAGAGHVPGMARRRKDKR